MRGPVGRTVPGIPITGKCWRIGHAFAGDELLQRIEPVPIIGLPGIGIACALGAFDLLGECGRPFRPGEQATVEKRQRHGEGLCLPRLAKDGTLPVAWNAGHRGDRLSDSARSPGMTTSVVHAGSRYGSNASTETLTVGSLSGPHSSGPSNTTV